MDQSRIDTDALLTHAAFLRRLARNLIKDTDTVEEVVQQTCIKAMEAPPSQPGVLRSWLGKVVINAAKRQHRDQERRRRREHRVARAEAQPSTAEIVEQASVIRSVADAVYGLKEPYRTTVILRFYENLSNKEIAGRLNVPLETVRTRLYRGLERLKGKLDHVHAGDRKQWVCALAPLAGIRLESTGMLSPTSSDAQLSSHPSFFSLQRLSVLSAIGIAISTVVVVSLGLFSETKPTSPSSPSHHPVGLDKQEQPPSGGSQGVASLSSASVPENEPTLLLDQPAVSNTGSLSLKLLFADGEPASEVSFGIAPQGVKVIERSDMIQTTGPSGSCHIEDLMTGDYRVFVDRTDQVFTLKIEPSRHVKKDFTLSPGITLRVRVVNHENVPVPGAEVLLGNISSTDFGIPVGTTSANGTLKIRDLSSDSIAVNARARDYAPSLPLVFRSKKTIGSLTKTVILRGQGAELSGTISGPHGLPVPDAQVTLFSSCRPELGVSSVGTFLLSPRPEKRRTNEQGDFHIHGLTSGKYRLLVEKKDLAPSLTTISVTAEIPTRSTIRLPEGVTVHGSVRNTSGTPSIGATLEITDGATCCFRPARIGKTEDKGNFKLTGLTPGQLKLRATGLEQGIESRAERTGLSGEQILWEPELSPGAIIHGTLTAQGGSPLEGFMVVAIAYAQHPGTDALPMPRQATSYTDDEGHFFIANRPLGPHHLEIHEIQTSRQPNMILDSIYPSPSPIELEIPRIRRATGFVHGTLVTPEGDPVSGAKISGTRELHDGPTTTTDGNGRFRLGPFVPGSLLVKVSVGKIAGLLPGSFSLSEIELQPDHTTDLGTIRLTRQGSLRAQIATENGIPSQRSVLQVWNENRTISRSCHFDGTTATLTGLFPGSYFFHLAGVFETNLASTMIPFEVQSGEETVLSLHTRNGISLRFQFKEESSPGLARRISAFIVDEQGNKIWTDQWLACHGGVLLPRIIYLLPGRYTLNALSDSGLRAQHVLQIGREPDPRIIKIPLRL